MDVFIVVDESESVGKRNYDNMIVFVKDFIQDLDQSVRFVFHKLLSIKGLLCSIAFSHQDFSQLAPPRIRPRLVALAPPVHTCGVHICVFVYPSVFYSTVERRTSHCVCDKLEQRKP